MDCPEGERCRCNAVGGGGGDIWEVKVKNLGFSNFQMVLSALYSIRKHSLPAIFPSLWLAIHQLRKINRLIPFSFVEVQ
jgi:hypothetical protein